MITDQQRKSAWQKVLEMILREFRLSENDLSKITGIQQSTINRITRGETKEPYPSTIKRLEDKLHIKIDETDPLKIKFIKRPVVVKQPETKNVQLSLKTFPLADESMFSKIIEYHKTKEEFNPEVISSIASQFVELPYKSETAIAVIYPDESNKPDINFGDVALCDYDEPISENDFVAWIGMDGNWYAGRYHRIDAVTFSIEPSNKKFPEKIIKNDNIASIMKIVLITRML